MHSDSDQTRAKIIIIAAICVFSTQFGVTVIAPLLGMWVKASETPFLTAALIFSAFTIVSTPLTIPGGIMSDKLGRKPLVIAGLLLYALASALFPFSTEPYDWIFVRALQGAGAGLFFPAITALLADVTSPRERGHAMSVYNVGLGIGLALGPASGGILFDRFGIFVPFFACVVFALLSVVLVLLFVHEPKSRERLTEHAKKKGLQLDAKGKKALALSGVVIFFGIGVAAIMGSLFSPFAFAPENLRLSTGMIGVILSTMFLVFAVLQEGFNRLMREIGELILSLTGLFLCACGLLVLYFATVVFELVVMSVLLGAGLGALSLGTLTLASKAAGEEERRGKVMGIYYTIFYAGLGIIPLICGLLADIFDTRLLFLAYAFLLFIVMVVVWRVGKKIVISSS
jgi:DHA1 family multidrug resistance protein-like MFS transporter